MVANSLNDSIFFAINNGLHGSVADVVVGYATWLGDGWVAFPLAIVGLIFVDRANFKRDFLMLLIAAIVEAILLQSLKSLVDAPRPLTVFTDAMKSGRAVVYVMFEPLYGRSFPSGHTQTIWCVATIVLFAVHRSPMSTNVRRICAAVITIIAIDVSISRIYVGAHFPSDVLGGFVLGVLPVIALEKLFRQKIQPA